MKKHLLLISLAMATLTANAQTKPAAKITGLKPASIEAPLSSVSANGRYAAGDLGAVTLLDLETGEETTFWEQANEGSTAKGVTNDGMIVGQYGVDLSAPGAVLKKGSDTWEMLPVPDGVNPNIEYAPQGVTPDGKYITGYGLETATGTYVPLYWTLQDDGTYKAETLPYPKEDIWGMRPQMVVCYGLSNDGTRAYGKIVDMTGFVTLGIVYKKGVDGTWSYQTMGEDWVIIGDKNPGPQPQLEDYVTAEEGTEEYWQQIAEFDLIMMDWNIAAHDYAKTSTSPYSQMMIGQNSMSGNGKWLVMSTPDEGVRLYDVDDMTYTIIPGTSGHTGCSVTNECDVITCSPYMSTYRSAYICLGGKEAPVNLRSWVEENYEVTYAGDDSDITGLGTCSTTPDGKTIVGWNLPQMEDMMYSAAIVQLGDDVPPTSIRNIDRSKQPTVEDGVLYIPDGKAEVRIYNAGGTLTATFTAEGSVDLAQHAKGVTIIKVRAGKLDKTFKLTL